MNIIVAYPGQLATYNIADFIDASFDDETLIKSQDIIKSWNSDTEVFEVQTSGSTGTPKTIAIKRQQFVDSAKKTINRFQIDSNDLCHLCLSPAAIGGRMVILRALLANSTLVITPLSNKPGTALSQIAPTMKPTVVSVVPGQVKDVLVHKELFEDAKLVLIGGSSLPKELEKDLHNSGIPGFVSYGMTETVSHIAIRSLGSSCYEILPEVEIQSDDLGLLSIKSDVTDYKWIKTNDLVNIHSNGLLEIVGRADDIIVSNGFKINPREVEKVIDEVVPDSETICLGIEDPAWGHILVAVSTSTFDQDKVGSQIGDKIHPYAVPRQWKMIEEIPLLSSGKPDIIGLRALFTSD